MKLMLGRVVDNEFVPFPDDKPDLATALRLLEEARSYIRKLESRTPVGYTDTVTDTAGGRKLVQVGWVKPDDPYAYRAHHPGTSRAWIDRYRSWGYVPVYREKT